MALSELECLEQRNKIIDELNADGCHYGDLLSRTVAEMKKKLMSKVAGFETVARLMLDLEKQNKQEMKIIKTMAIDAIACTHAAQKTVNEMESKTEVVRARFDRVVWKLLWIILGGNGLFVGVHLAIMLLSK